MIVRSGIAMILADELEADWQRVDIRQAPGDETRFDPAGKDQQNTEGSRSIRHHFEVMRELGAAGRYVNPEGVKKQMEGAAVDGHSLAMHGQITTTRGAVDQSNFHDYPIARMGDAPLDVRTHIVEDFTHLRPCGVGEPGLRPTRRRWSTRSTEVECVSLPSPSAISWSPLSTADDGAGGERSLGACAAGVHGCKSALIRPFGRSISSNMTGYSPQSTDRRDGVAEALPVAEAT